MRLKPEQVEWVVNDIAELGVKIGDIFYGTEGVLAISSYTSWQAFMGPKLEKGKGGGGGGDHFANFVAAVRKRDRTLLNADIEEGHNSTRLCHLGNIAYRTGQTLHFDTASETILLNTGANQLLGREYRKGFELPVV